jgi:2-phospho-L-lactate transferase/gluconeogenesis factor (CofD/UPF0052 family)
MSQTKEEIVAQVRDRLTPDKQVCPACWQCRIHTKDEYARHPGEGRGGVRNETRIKEHTSPS